jgi:N-acetylglutamate synthase-like GNAT family acetyltransferase
MVRLAARADIDQILRLDSSAEARKSRQAVVQNAIDRGECLVALDDGMIVGYAVMNHGFFERGFVALMYIVPTYRRHKVGSSLFAECESRCKSARIFTSTNESNLPMQRFLASRGYVLSGKVQDLDKGDPELFYSKRLR